MRHKLINSFLFLRESKFCMQAVQTLFRRRVLRRLSWVCSACQCPFCKHTCICKSLIKFLCSHDKQDKKVMEKWILVVLGLCFVRTLSGICTHRIRETSHRTQSVWTLSRLHLSVWSDLGPKCLLTPIYSID